MKKFLAIVLMVALALSQSVTAFAEDRTIDESVTLPATKDTTVQFNVDPTYTITIPAEVKLDRVTDTETGAVTYKQEAIITASAGVRLLNGQTIQVTLSAGDGETAFVLTTDEKAELAYTVTVVEGKNAAAIASGGTVATFGTSLEAQTSKLQFAANDPAYAGEYSDTVTFNIAIVPQDTTTP